jgi:hypothetical protein
MRQISVLILAVVLLVFAASVDAAIGIKHPRAAQRKRNTIKSQNDIHGDGYRLMSQLIAAVHYKNWTWASSLLADDGMYRVSDVSCGWLNKTTLLNLIKENAEESSQAIPGTWVETDNGLTIMKAEVAAIDKMATYYNSDVYYAGLPTQDGSQLMWLERVSDRSMRQMNNATQMMDVWNQIKAAETVGDITVWDRVLRQDFNFSLNFAWDQYPAVMWNRTSFLANLQDDYSKQASNYIHTNAAFPVCDAILADIWAFKRNTDGHAFVQKFFLSIKLDSMFKISWIEEYAVGYM